jgi:hypothetical protein
VILLLMMRFRPQGFLPSRQREAELIMGTAVQGEVDLTAPIDEETGEPIILENIEPAPPGQSEIGPEAREPETPDEARRL